MTDDKEVEQAINESSAEPDNRTSVSGISESSDISGNSAESPESDETQLLFGSLLSDPKKDSEWIVARHYLSKIGAPSALFTGCCRTLCKSDQGKMSKSAATQLTRLLGSPSMLAQLFYAAKTYYPQEIATRGSIEPADFAFFMRPEEIATIIAIGYSARRTLHLLDSAESSLILESFQRYADISMPLGFAIPIIGPTRALMVGAGKHLGWSVFNVANKEKFKKYRVANKVKGVSYNLAEEKAIFGTTHLHIASLIWQRFGLGIQLTEDYFSGLSEASLKEISPTAVRFRVARFWIESYMEKGTPPTQELGDQYELDDPKFEKFIETFEKLKSDGSKYSWLMKSKDDIDSEKTPELIADYEGMKKVLAKRSKRGV